MKSNTNKLLVTFLGLILVFSYLTYHHFMVKLGLGGPSLCQINAVVNCDNAALSKYSEYLGIPIAIFGLSYSAIMFITMLCYKYNWLEKTKGLAFLSLSSIGAGSAFSLALLGVSIFQLKSFCPFCIASYILIFIAAYFLIKEFKSEFKFSLSFINDEMGLVGLFIAIPVLAWFISGSLKNNYGLNELQQVIPEKVQLWKMSPPQTFDLTSGLIKQVNADAPNTLVEFADFKCPHCKAAAQSLKNFTKSNSQVKFIFKPYPLDGTCNNGISAKGDGSRCELAGWALCGEKLFQRGWDVFYWIFDNQEDLGMLTDLESPLKSMSAQLGINSDELKKCATSNETYELIKKYADEGNQAKITGTPTFFLNNKKLELAQYVDVLRSALNDDSK